MIAQYLGLAIILAITLNHSNQFIRAGGMLLVTIGFHSSFCRYIWLILMERLPPSHQKILAERFIAKAVRPALYTLIILMPLTGLLLTMFSGEPLELYGWRVPLPATASASGALWQTLHDQIPFLFYAIIAVHLGAVFKHHFLAQHTTKSGTCRGNVSVS